MALEPQVKEIEIKSNKKLESLKANIPVTLATTGEKIEKVLLTKSFVKIEKTVVSQGGIQIEGVLNSCALIKVENGEFVEIKKSTNFSQNYVSTKIDVNTKVLVNAKVLAAENLSVNEISLSFVQEISLTVFVCEKQILKYVEELNKANQKIGTINYQSIVNFSTENFELLNEIDIPSSISKVLICESEINLKDYNCAKDIVNLNGEICTSLIYLTNDELPKIKQQNYVSEFHQEILLNGVCEGDMLSLQANITNSSYNIVGEMNSKGILELKNNVQVCIIARRQFLVSYMQDAFCPLRELNLSYQSVQMQSLMFRKNYVDKVDGSYELNSESQIAQIVFCSRGDAKVLEIKKEQNSIITVGEVNLFVAIRLDDEKNTFESVNIIIPFEHKCIVDDEIDDDKIFVDVKIKEMEARNKRAKEIDVLVDLCFDVVALKNQDEVVLSDACLGEKRKEDLCSMGIYVINSANDCWEVAKKLLINPNILMEQNKELTFPITKPTQIVVYRQKSIE